ncbi:MAG: DNA primase small subunit domain-containing protein [Candidatus Bathycorpusculaceae bacterium]
MNFPNFVQETFRKYYAEVFPLNASVPLIDKREFGFASFENQMVRHKSFRSVEEVKFFMQNFVPSDVYYSCAYYENPMAEMERKNWLGADLIFDIDADHIPVKCEKVHDRWTCGDCGFVGKGVKPEKCPLCGGEKLSVETWPCEICLDAAKFEAIKLLEVLQDDFGFSRNEVRVFFSGHRGYHVHVECEAVKSLDSMARKEIVDYVIGLGLGASLFHVEEKGFKRRFPLETVKFSGFGWSKRLTEGLQIFLSNVKEGDLRKLGFRKDAVNAIMQRRDAILREIYNSGMVHAVRGFGFKTWEKLVNHVVTLESVKIDTVVTTDVHRLIRMPETLNGKTGFKKAEVSISAMEDFDPFKDAIAFRKGNAEVWVSDAPKFRIGDETFGPYRNRKVELPMAAVLLLVCRGRAEVVGNV